MNGSPLLQTIMDFLPAMLANAAPVLAASLLGKSLSTPVDFGKRMGEKRVLGDGKTWRGLFAGVLAGGATGLLLGDAAWGLLLGGGAMLGDLAGSFLKRRRGIKRGEKAGLLDQTDFALGALLVSWQRWSLAEAVFLLLLMPPLHRSTNLLAHAAGIKDVPW